jgi:hypothetical protein
MAAVAVVLSAAGAASAHRGAPQWTMAKLLRRLGGASVHVGSWTGHVQTASTLCSGDGRAARWGGIGHWRHFTCTWTVFAGGIDRDVTFRVHTLTRTRFLITNARFGAE